MQYTEVSTVYNKIIKIIIFSFQMAFEFFLVLLEIIQVSILFWNVKPKFKIHFFFYLEIYKNDYYCTSIEKNANIEPFFGPLNV